MKKYLVLSSVLVLAIGGLLFRTLTEDPPRLATAELHAGTVERTVICTGRVEATARNREATTAVAASAGVGGMQVRLAVGEHLLRRVQIGQRVYISGVAFDKERYEGTLSYLSPAASRPSGSSEAIVEAVVTLAPDQIDDSVRAGLSAKAAVVVDVAENSLLLPYDCVLQDDEGQEYVYCVRDGRAVKTVVTPLAEMTDGFLVDATGLDGGVLITTPDRVPQDGARVRTGGTR